MATSTSPSAASPQDGRMSVTHNGRKIDLRVATLPTVWGEKVVMRILDNSTAQPRPARPGVRSTTTTTRYSTSYTKPYGMILVTGPTGFGQVDDALRDAEHRRQPEINVITVEDPVEYRLAGINQVQVEPQGRPDLRRARCARSCGPTPTSSSSVRSATTRPRRSRSRRRSPGTSCSRRCTPTTPRAPSPGSSRWASSRSSSVRRVDCVLAQRLARRLCSKCKEAVRADAEALVSCALPVGAAASRCPTLYRPSAARPCSKTGYKGRLALHEVDARHRGRSSGSRSSTRRPRQIRDRAEPRACSSLREDGMHKVAAGVTSIEEILRVVV